RLNRSKGLVLNEAPRMPSEKLTTKFCRPNRSSYIDPDDSSVVFAATTAGLFRRPAAAPFTNWTQVNSATFTNYNGFVTDLIVAGTGASKRYYAVFQNDRVYRSPD